MMNYAIDPSGNIDEEQSSGQGNLISSNPVVENLIENSIVHGSYSYEEDSQIEPVSHNNQPHQQQTRLPHKPQQKSFKKKLFSLENGILLNRVLLLASLFAPPFFLLWAFSNFIVDWNVNSKRVYEFHLNLTEELKDPAKQARIFNLISNIALCVLVLYAAGDRSLILSISGGSLQQLAAPLMKLNALASGVFLPLLIVYASWKLIDELRYIGESMADYCLDVTSDDDRSYFKAGSKAFSWALLIAGAACMCAPGGQAVGIILLLTAAGLHTTIDAGYAIQKWRGNGNVSGESQYTQLSTEHNSSENNPTQQPNSTTSIVIKNLPAEEDDSANNNNNNDDDTGKEDEEQKVASRQKQSNVQENDDDDDDDEDDDFYEDENSSDNDNNNDNGSRSPSISRV